MTDRTTALVDDVLDMLPHLTGDELRRVAEAMPRVAGEWETKREYTQRCYIEVGECGPDLAASVWLEGGEWVEGGWVDGVYKRTTHPTARAAQAACDARLRAAGVALCGEVVSDG